MKGPVSRNHLRLKAEKKNPPRHHLGTEQKKSGRKETQFTSSSQTISKRKKVVEKETFSVLEVKRVREASAGEGEKEQEEENTKGGGERVYYDGEGAKNSDRASDCGLAKKDPKEKIKGGDR